MEDLSIVIQGCVANDPKQQKAFYEHYFGYCLKVVFRYVYRYETAVDIVNDGFVKIFRSVSKFVVTDKENTQMLLMGWMRTIMIHAAIDHLRKNSFLPEIGSLSDAAWELADNSGPADKTILYKELILHVKKLSPAYRAVFNLYVIDGFSHQEIAQALGISVGTSKSNLSKARIILQNSIRRNEQGIKHAVSR
ncbi:RNA polymerase sigma factor [Flavisolibacter sp. BT320]|nr:RNA polymerase sigma factor [Flavisolibacter longurius]